MLCLAIGSASLPSGPALACQSSDQELEQARQMKRWNRQHADVVVTGTLQIGADCDDFGERCWGQLSVAEVHRGAPASQLAVRFETTSSMCDALFWPSPSSHTGQFYLDRIARTDTYKLVEFVRPRPTAE